MYNMTGRPVLYCLRPLKDIAENFLGPASRDKKKTDAICLPLGESRSGPVG